MISYLQKFTQTVSAARDWLWNYPDLLFWGRTSLRAKMVRIYLLTRPFSHFAASIMLTVALLIFLGSGRLHLVNATAQDTLVEAVVMGTSEDGRLQQLSRVSPLLPTAIQLERDVSELVYEPLIIYNQDGSIEPVLVSQITRIQEGADYEFEIKQGVKWHDFDHTGELFDVDDVIRTLEIISQLDENNTNSYVQAIKQMTWERTGDYSIRICTVTNPEEVARLANKCSGASGDKPILANFLELVSIKIVPAHLSADLNSRTISTPEPYLNRFPVGTGKYRFAGASTGDLLLERNEDYHREPPQISRIRFKLFKTEAQAVQALQNGEVHTLTSTSTEFFLDNNAYPQLNAHKSPVLQNQYWAVYFNLRKTPEGKPIGPEFFQDVNVRRAIAAAVNRAAILEVLNGVGTEAFGPIAPLNEFFNPAANYYDYDAAAANSLLKEAGWEKVNSEGIRMKDGVRLSFKLSFVDTFDRQKIAKSIQQDLRNIGVEVILDPHDLNDLTTQVVTPKLFDTLLYGMSTFIDPDRFELFHSEQGAKLNLSSYVGSDETRKISGNTTVTVPRVDRLLEQGRSFDPLAAKDSRKEVYSRFQELLAGDSPVVFLYHPQFLYYANTRLKNLDLSNVGNLEQRFKNINKWEVN